jgi:hypothetical protein
VDGRLVAIYEVDAEVMKYDTASFFIRDYTQYLRSYVGKESFASMDLTCACRLIELPGLASRWHTPRPRGEKRAVAVDQHTESVCFDLFEKTPFLLGEFAV